jgi:hypothetical protein
VRFGRTTDAHIDLGAAPVVAVPAAALPAIVAAAPGKPAWVRPAAIAALGASVASAVIGVAFHARADSTASGLNGSGFYVAAAVLAAAGGGLLWWDLNSDAVGVQTQF